MPTVSGSLISINRSPSTVAGAWVRAKATRPFEDGLLVGAQVPATINSAGVVTFEAVEGPGVLVLQQHNGPPESIPILVPTGGSATLAKVVEDAQLADGETETSLNSLMSELRAEMGAAETRIRQNYEASFDEAVTLAEDASRAAAVDVAPAVFRTDYTLNMVLDGETRYEGRPWDGNYVVSISTPFTLDLPFDLRGDVLMRFGGTLAVGGNGLSQLSMFRLVDENREPVTNNHPRASEVPATWTGVNGGGWYAYRALNVDYTFTIPTGMRMVSLGLYPWNGNSGLVNLRGVWLEGDLTHAGTGPTIGQRTIALDTDGTPYYGDPNPTHWLLQDAESPYIAATVALGLDGATTLV